MKYVVILITFFSSFHLKAQENFLLKQVIDQLQLTENDVNMKLITSKILPYAKNKIVFVIPKFAINESDDYSFYDAYVVISDSKTGKVLEKYFEPQKWISDAISLQSIYIDTGLYKLNQQIRAFAIRVSYSGNSRLNPYAESNFSLFIEKKTKLTCILSNFTIEQYSGEWDGNCFGEFNEETITIALDKTKTNGFFNLILTSKKKNTINSFIKNDCVDVTTETTQKSKLIFNGKIYN